MVLRTMRLFSAGILTAAAVLGSPAASRADTQILIQELDGLGNPISGASQIFTGTTASFTTPDFTNIQVGTTPNSGAIGSLNTTVTAALASNLNTANTLQVIVTSDGFVNPFPGQPAKIDNNVGASSGIVGGTNQITGTTQVFGVPLSPPANQIGQIAGGPSIVGPSAVAIATSPVSGTVSDTQLTSTSLPTNFAIQQTITVRATPDVGGAIATGSTVGGTVGSTVVTNASPVPAPAGLLLALSAIPVVGIRRILRKKA
ncbi:MAG TPA: hypothetical protein VGI99_11110 [Gemmataceae bacterium]